MKTFAKIVLALLVLAAAAYYPLVRHSPQPGSTPYALDLAAVRREAARLHGQRPQRVRVEKIGEFVFAQAMVMAGEPWQATPIPVYSYLLEYADRSIVIDTAMSRIDGVPDAMVKSFDAAALARLQQAMVRAELIAITHEHFDHIGGLLEHPQLPQLLPRTRLTAEQLAHEDRMQPLTLPPGVFDGYTPLVYEGLHALAPGVVLIKAPGHTPGSQMVYVQRADGTELLLLGDVAWQWRNIAAVRERPLFMTALIKENREQVINQFQALHELSRAEPGLHLVPGHDGVVVGELLRLGVLQEGFPASL